MAVWSYLFTVEGEGTFTAPAASMSFSLELPIEGIGVFAATAGQVLGASVVPPVFPNAQCIPQGWGSGPWGTTPWGGSTIGAPGGTIPVDGDFDIYCVGPCGPMSYLLTYDEVEEDGDPTQFAVDPTTLDLLVMSGGPVPTHDARITVNTIVPQSFTLDLTVAFPRLPNDFSEIVDKHIYIGASNASGYCVGLFFSKAGILYTGSVHHLGGPLPDQDLVLDTPTQLIPDTAQFGLEDQYWTIRLSVDGTTGTVFFYMTNTVQLSAIGHQLRAVLPAIPSSSAAQLPPDQTYISVRGSVGDPCILALDNICLGTGAIVPNLPPIADAGEDQSTKMCAIVQLNGKRSFDPEGGPLTYIWRLIDAPSVSGFMFSGFDGTTLSVPGILVDRMYSAELAEVHDIDPIVVGDVLVFEGEPYSISEVGTDVDGFYVVVGGEFLQEALSGQAFKILRQRGISGPTTVQPTFFPDVPGLYKFDLLVTDGQLSSLRSLTVINVVDSPIARGVTPDLSFMWSYLSNFWSLVEDRESITTFWGALAQVAASELLSLWQIDYSKSLRDVQRTFQRRWLHYDLEVKEQLPDQVTVAPFFGGVRQTMPFLGLQDLASTQLTFTIPFFGETGEDVVITAVMPATQYVSAAQVAAIITPLLKLQDDRFEVTVTRQRDGLIDELHIAAPFYFEVSESPYLLVEAVNQGLVGTGAGIGARTYKVDRPLNHLGDLEGRLLVLQGPGDAFVARVQRVVDDPSDEWPFQRLVLDVDLPVPTPTNWAIRSEVVSLRTDFYNGMLGPQDIAYFGVFDVASGREIELSTTGIWPSSQEPGRAVVELGVIANYIQHPAREFAVTYSRAIRLTHVPIDPLVVDIPLLQEMIKDPVEDEIFRRNIDFYLEEFRGAPSIRFAFEGFGSSSDVWQDPAALPTRLWAESTHLDNRPRIEGNFGIPAEFTLDDWSELPNNVDYLSVVRGLWYAYFKGPTIQNLRIGSQILLGLPFAEEAGTIREIRDTFSVSQGRILIEDLSTTGIVRSYTYPAGLSLETNPDTGAPYAVGDVVAQFTPLVTGVSVVDYVKDERWFAGLMNQGAFYEVEKFFKFMVRIDSEAFDLSSLLFVRNFILRIKPTYTFPMFVVSRTVSDTEISVTDLVQKTATLSLYDGACTIDPFANATPDGMGGVSTIFDEPDPSGGGWQSNFDWSNNHAVIPPFGFPDPVIQWGFDRNFLCPEDFIELEATLDWPGGIPTEGLIFYEGQSVYSAGVFRFYEPSVGILPVGDLVQLTPLTVPGDAAVTVSTVRVEIEGFLLEGPGTLDLQLLVNGVVEETLSIVYAPIDQHFMVEMAATLPATTGADTISAIIVATGATSKVLWDSITVLIGGATELIEGAALPAGTYVAYLGV